MSQTIHNHSTTCDWYHPNLQHMECAKCFKCGGRLENCVGNCGCPGQCGCLVHFVCKRCKVAQLPPMGSGWCPNMRLLKNSLKNKGTAHGRCLLNGCQNHKMRKRNGGWFDYCCRDHAKKDKAC